MSEPRKRKKRQLHPVIKGVFSLIVIAALLYLSTFAFRFCLGLFLEGDYIVQLPGQDPPVVSQQPREDNTPTEPGAIEEVARANILVAGDLMTHMPIVNSGESDGEYNFDYIFSYAAPYVSKADYAVVNLETTLAGTENGNEYTGFPNFNAPDAIASGAGSGGFDMMLTANNHCYDYGTDGLLRTLDVIKSAGLDTLGTTQLAEDIKYAVKVVSGIRVGMVNYTFAEIGDDRNLPVLNDLQTKANASGLINVFDYDNLDLFYTEMENVISGMRAAGAEAIVLYIHWGNDLTDKVSDNQKAMAQKLCDLGVDVIAGSHPHVVQPIELLTGTADENHKTLCMYSMGNFLSNQRSDNISLTTGQSEDGVLFSFSLVKYSNGEVYIDSAQLMPTWILIRGSGDGRTYHVLPLDTQVTDWGEAYDLTASQSSDAHASYERTMKTVGDKLTEVQTALADWKTARDEAFGVVAGGIG